MEDHEAVEDERLNSCDYQVSVTLGLVWVEFGLAGSCH